MYIFIFLQWPLIDLRSISTIVAPIVAVKNVPEYIAYLFDLSGKFFIL